MPKLRTLHAAFALSALLACGGNPPAPPAVPAPPHEVVAKETAHPKHWTYAGAEGPEHWSDLETAFTACSTGTKQTPIDLPATAPAAAPGAPALSKPSYAPVPLHVVNNGHTIQVNNTAPSSLTVGGTKYDLAQFHFHSPSEHTIAGKRFDAEMHLVHKSEAGKLLVVGLLFSKGKENAILKPVFDAMPSEPSKEDAIVPGVSIDVAALLPAAPRFTHYEGSLTTPPCSEGVSWFVVAPEKSGGLELSEAQLARFQGVTHGPTNRPVQPLNAREIVEVRSK